MCAFGIGLFIIILSCYGMLSIKKTGGCGCIGRPDTTSKSGWRPRFMLLTRNVILFGFTIFGNVPSSDLREAIRRNAMLACSLSTSPAIFFIIILLIRFARMTEREEQIAGAIHYRAQRAYLLR